MTPDFDLTRFLPYLLNQAAEEASLAFQDIYKTRYGLLRTEWRVLFHLGQIGDMTANEICRRSRMHKTKISRAVQKLETRRLLSRQTDAGDRRREVLSLTPEGRVIYQKLRGEAEVFEQRLADAFDPDEIRVLRSVLTRIADGETKI